MKINKIIAGALVVLGFGSAVGLGGGCARRAQKSKSADDRPAADSIIIRDGGEMPVRVMYGVPPARFEPVRQVGEISDESDNAESLKPATK